jgi:putative NADH-flavin reductase
MNLILLQADRLQKQKNALKGPTVTYFIIPSMTDKKLQKIAVIGGTGRSGRYMIDQLLEKGYQLKALARDPARLLQSGPNLERVTGNVRDYSSIYGLLQGCDAVISTLGPSKSEPDTCSISIDHVIHAMQELKIKRYIEVAGLAIDTPGDKKGFQTRMIVYLLRWFFPDVINDRLKGYLMLSESQLDWTIVRCPMIKPAGATGHIKISLKDCPGRKISTGDLAVFLVRQLDDDKYIRKAPFISN